jgi:uncharacterized caspase-like protein
MLRVTGVEIMRRVLRLGVVVIFSLVAFASAALAQSRNALVIGNGAYTSAPALKTPTTDASIVAETLRAAGYNVTELHDIRQATIGQSMRDFLDKVAAGGPDGIAYVYYAGYGAQSEGENYLVPVDAVINRDADVANEAFRLNDLLQELADLPLAARVVILDASYDHRLGSAGNQPVPRGLAMANTMPEMLIAFAAAPGAVTGEQDGTYSLFTGTLVTLMRQSGLDMEQIFKTTRLQVNKQTAGAQTPWMSGDLTGDLILFGATASAPTPEQVAGTRIPPKGERDVTKEMLRSLSPDEAYGVVIEEDTLDAYQWFVELFPQYQLAPAIWDTIETRREAVLWRRSLAQNTTRAYWNYLKRYPNGAHAQEAQNLLEAMSAPPTPPVTYVPVPEPLPPDYSDEAVGLAEIVPEGFEAPPDVFDELIPLFIPRGDRGPRDFGNRGPRDFGNRGPRDLGNRRRDNFGATIPNVKGNPNPPFDKTGRDKKNKTGPIDGKNKKIKTGINDGKTSKTKTNIPDGKTGTGTRTGERYTTPGSRINDTGIGNKGKNQKPGLNLPTSGTPGTNTGRPTTPGGIPGTNTGRPITPGVIPGANTGRPTKPGLTIPGTNTGRPTTPGVIPGTNTGRPTTPGVIPGASTGRPTKPGLTIPGTNTGRPTTPGVIPGTNTGRPTTPGVLPGTNTGRPTTPGVIPGANTGRPTTPGVLGTSRPGLPPVPGAIPNRPTTPIPTVPNVGQRPGLPPTTPTVRPTTTQPTTPTVRPTTPTVRPTPPVAHPAPPVNRPTVQPARPTSPVARPTPPRPAPVARPAPQRAAPVARPTPPRPAPVARPAPQRAAPVARPAPPPRPAPVARPAPPPRPAPVARPAPAPRAPVCSTVNGKRVCR